MHASAVVSYREIADSRHGGNFTVHERAIRVTRITLVDLIPMPAPRKRRGRSYAVESGVIMIVRHVAKAHTLLAIPHVPTDEMRKLRALMTESRRYPSRRTVERRLQPVPETLPAQISCLARCLVALILPFGRTAHIRPYL